MPEKKTSLPRFNGKISGLKVNGVQQPGATYSDWRYKLQSKVMAKSEDIWNYMSSETDDRPDGDDEEKYTGFLEAITESLGGEALRTAKACVRQSPRSILTALDAMFLSQSLSSRTLAISKLVGDKQGNDSVDDFIEEKKRLLREELNGEMTADEVLLGAVLSGLRDDYSDLANTVMSVENQDENPSLDELQSKLPPSSTEEYEKAKEE